MTLASTAAERLDTLFARAMAARGSGIDAGNLYEGERGPAEMLEAFEALVRGTPLVRFGHVAANAAILRVLGDGPELDIVDIGLGMGAQWEDLLDRLAVRPGGPPSVHLTGIDLPVPGADPACALRATGDRLAAYATGRGVPFRFTALPGAIETVALPARVGPSLPLASGGGPGRGACFVVNAAFALHHTASGDAVADPRVARDAVLARLRAVGADAVVLVEPESDHDTADLDARIRAARHHYGLVFRVLERCLADRPGPRGTIEQAFFGREILNVVACEGPARVERHSPTTDWSRRMAAAGFAGRSLSGIGTAVAPALVLPAGVRVASHRYGARLQVDGHALVDVSVWRPAA